MSQVPQEVRDEIPKFEKQGPREEHGPIDWSALTSIQGARSVAPGVSVGAQQGASGDSSRGIVEIEVLPHTKIEGSFGTDSNEKIGAKMEWDY